MTGPIEEMVLCHQEKIAVKVMFDQVTITVTCRSAYEAQILFDDLKERFQAGEEISIKPGRPAP